MHYDTNQQQCTIISMHLELVIEIILTKRVYKRYYKIHKLQEEAKVQFQRQKLKYFANYLTTHSKENQLITLILNLM